jgi:hypothetical protein
MQLRSTLSLTLLALLPIAACSSEQLASKGQMISCTTDPTTGAIGRCAPVDGTGDGSGSGSGACQDIDEDGDGEPHDDGDDHPVSTLVGDDDHGGDRDHDGIPDDRDCDEHPGEDGERGNLPYDVRPELGATTRPIIDAFAASGGQPAELVSIEGSSWRQAELQAGTAFVVTQADCDHAGNRDTGRDRVIVTWKNADHSTSSDHLDIRYCH